MAEDAVHLDPNKVQICRIDPIKYGNGQPCNCPAGTCWLYRGGLKPAIQPKASADAFGPKSVPEVGA